MDESSALAENVSLDHILSDQGPLAEQLQGFAAREPQLKMAQAVAQSLNDEKTLITEAGTGTGKTFAYLIPALLSGKKLLISTGTKHLQEQLFNRDIPTVRDILKLPIQVALLKGRNNYICLHRLKTTQESGTVSSLSLVADLTKVARFKQYSTSGDIADIDGVSEDSAIWPYVTSNSDNCLGQDCQFFKDCYINQARRKAQQAELVVINHHLFFADMSLKDDGFGELLPDADAIIFDEAHQIAEVASQFLGTVFSSRQLILLAKDVQSEYDLLATDMAELPIAAQRLEIAVTDMRAALGDKNQRSPWQTVKQQASLSAAIARLDEELIDLQQILEIAAERSTGLENCWKRCAEIGAKFRLLTGATPERQIHWFETFNRAFSLHFTPMDLQQTLGSYIQQKKMTWIFTSATLAVGNSFKHMAENLGLQQYNSEQLDSPFDYQTQALLYTPRGLPDPKSSTYTESCAKTMLPVLEASQGRAFYLFTSHRALREAETYLKQHLNFPLLTQGDLPKSQLLEQFRQLDNAVLLGTHSFWEGVDVRGDDLSCVIIEKLPFAVPDEPILKARLQNIKEKGGHPFQDYQIPAAAIQLKQGAGRLIRDVTDRGVLVICDPRIVAREYGAIFLKSLPNMPRTRELDDVISFFKEPSS